MRSFSLLAALPLLTIACASATREGASSEANLDAADLRLEAVKGREYARCWFDVAGSNATLSCTSTARGADPVEAKVEVLAAATPFGQPLQPGPTVGRTLDIDAGGTTVVGSFPRASFPVTIVLNATILGASRKELGISNFNTFKNSLQVSSPEDMPSARSTVLGQPFDLWPVGFLDARTEPKAYGVSADVYTRPIAPYRGFFDSDAAFELRPEFFTDEQGMKPRWFVAPQGGPLSLMILDVPGVERATITAPGYHVMTDTGLRPATSAEIARLLGGALDAGAPPAEDASPPAEDAGTPAPADDPTCGGDRQQACKDLPKKCDDGTRWTYERTQCTACGDEGQTYCFQSADNYDANVGKRCNDGTRWVYERSSCLACGGEGQTFCTTSTDNYSAADKRCNAGLRWEYSRSACIK